MGKIISGTNCKKEYAPALYEDAIYEYLNPDSKSYNPMLGRYRLSNIADKGFEPALQQLMERHLTGHVLERNLGAAYYWLERGETFGFDVTPWRSRIEQLVSDQDRQWAQSFNDRGKVPQPWDLE